MAISYKENGFNIENCRNYSFDIINELPKVGVDGILKKISEEEKSMSSDIKREEHLSKNQKKILEQFCFELSRFALKKYFDLIQEEGNNSSILDEPIEGFSLEKINKELGFLPSNTILLEFLNKKIKTHSASFELSKDSSNTLYLFLKDFRFSKTNKYLLVTISSEIKETPTKKKFLGLF